MATVSFQFISVQETLTEVTAQQGGTNPAPQNPVETPAGNAPQETVTLFHGVPEPLVPILHLPGSGGQPGAAPGANDPATDTAHQVQIPAISVPPPPPVDVDAPKLPPAPTFVAPSGNLSAAGPNIAIAIGTGGIGQLSPQQELAQLDHTLQRLGIDPTGISLVNRMALLLYAQDPAALKILVEALQTANQQLTQLAGLTKAGGAQSPGQSVARPNFTEIQGTVIQQNQPGNPAGGAAAQPNPNSIQFQELQLSFSALEIHGTQGSSSNPSNANSAGPSINVKA